jgi:protein tyrosine phosphatase (PTP) superfamily phosphohydrolase (DUF442 family)
MASLREKNLPHSKTPGVEVVITLALHDDPMYSLPGEKGRIDALGMTCIHIPVLFDNPTRCKLEAFFDAMGRCAGGEGPSPFVPQIGALPPSRAYIG